MKKSYFLGFCFTLIFAFSAFFSQANIVYAEQETVQVIVNSCNLYIDAKIDYSSEEPETDGVILELSFGDILEKKSQELDAEDSSQFKFYWVSVTKNSIVYEGYIIANFVMSTDNVSLARTLDPNAKAIRETYVYSADNESNKLILNGEEVSLDQYQDIKIIDGYDAAKPFHKIMFEEEGVIYIGYIKTSDLLIEGFDGTLILVVFIVILVLSIASSIFFTTRKKRKKLRLKNKE